MKNLILISVLSLSMTQTSFAAESNLGQLPRVTTFQTCIPVLNQIATLFNQFANDSSLSLIDRVSSAQAIDQYAAEQLLRCQGETAPRLARQDYKNRTRAARAALNEQPN